MAALYRDALMCAARIALAGVGTAIVAVEPSDAGLWGPGETRSIP
jgi:hypothetical protein